MVLKQKTMDKIFHAYNEGNIILIEKMQLIGLDELSFNKLIDYLFDKFEVLESKSKYLIMRSKKNGRTKNVRKKHSSK